MCAGKDGTEFRHWPSRLLALSRYVLDNIAVPTVLIDVQELVLRVDRIETGELTVDQPLKSDF